MNFQLSLFQNLIEMNYSKKSLIQLGVLYILLAFAASSCQKASDKIPVENLKCEYLVNPIGIDAEAPRLAWQITGNKNGLMQTAIKIIVGTDSLEVASGKGNEWNSGKIKSENSMAIYSGKSLKPFTKYFWSVKIWDENDTPSNHSKVASFETGMMETKN